MPLLRRGEIAADPFARVHGDDALPDETGVIVDLARWQREKGDLIGRAGGVGVELAAGESPDEIAEDLDHLAVIALEFPAFNDGRAFSSARLLRERYHYQGEIRAVGDVLLEQLHFMSRVGFDSFQIDSDDPSQDWKTAQSDMQLWYQPTEDGRTTIREKRRR